MTSIDVMKRICAAMRERFPSLDPDASVTRDDVTRKVTASVTLRTKGRLNRIVQLHEATAATPGWAAGALAKSLVVDITEEVAR